MYRVISARLTDWLWLSSAVVLERVQNSVSKKTRLPVPVFFCDIFGLGAVLEIWWLRKILKGLLVNCCQDALIASPRAARREWWMHGSWYSWKVKRKWKVSEIKKSDLALQTNLKRRIMWDQKQIWWNFPRSPHFMVRPWMRRWVRS